MQRLAGAYPDPGWGAGFPLALGLAQRSALRDMDERTSLVRVIFLYGTLLATLVPVVHSA